MAGFSCAASAEELFVEGEITTQLARDLDGDGLRELLVAYHRDEQRHLAVFQGATTFARTPQRVLPVDPQAVLFAVGDYDSAPGLDVVLLSRSSGIIYPIAPADAAPAPRRLFKTSLFFHMPSVTHLPVWLSRRPTDLDGDGRDDFVLPEGERLRLLSRREDGEDGEIRWGRDQELFARYYLLIDSEPRRMRRAVESFADREHHRANVLEAAAAFPFPVFVDFDGDDRTDIVVKQVGNLLEVFTQGPEGEFAAQARVRVALPWASDVASILIEDVDLDGKADLVASRLLLRDLATEVLVFLQTPDRGDYGFVRPRQQLRVSGFFQRPALADADLDGRPDLLVATYRLDLLEQIKSETVDEIGITYQVYRAGLETPFDRRAAFKREFQLRTALFQRGGNRPPIYIGSDITGDGRSDLLLVDGGGWMRLYAAVDGDGIRYEEETEFAFRVRDPKKVSLVDLDDRPGEEVVLEYPRHLRILRR